MEEMDTVVLEVGDIINVVYFSGDISSDTMIVHTHPMFHIKEVSQTLDNKYIYDNKYKISIYNIIKIYSMEGKLIYQRNKNNITIGVTDV